jgi:glycosyltransferase involved in cell wall biosynthesis
MLLSIITVCFNEAKRIKETAESVVNQTIKKFEWIVIDGGSSDGTLEILEHYRLKIDIFISEKDNGIYNAMNKGIGKAKGKYLLFLNGGDHLYDKNIIEKINEKLENKADFICGDLVIENPNGTRELWQLSSNISFNYFWRAGLPHSGTFIKRDLFEEFGLYNESYKICADFEWFVRTFKKRKLFTQYVNFPISVFYRDGLSQQNQALRRKEEKHIKKKYYSLYFRLYHNAELKEILFNSLKHPRFFLGLIKKQLLSKLALLLSL